VAGCATAAAAALARAPSACGRPGAGRQALATVGRYSKEKVEN